jgi:succinoglycan biosynthesis protein ExoA
LAPALFVAVLALLTLAAPFWQLALWSWAALGSCYLLGSTAAAVLACRKAGWDLLPILPLVFACYHFGYGYGFLRGTWDALIFRKTTSRSAFRVLTR